MKYAPEIHILMQFLTKEALLLLALSTATNDDGLTMNEAVRALKTAHSLTISESAARAAAKELMKLSLVENGVRKVPTNRRVAAGHYRLTEQGREALRGALNTLYTIVVHTEPRLTDP